MTDCGRVNVDISRDVELIRQALAGADRPMPELSKTAANDCFSYESDEDNELART